MGRKLYARNPGFNVIEDELTQLIGAHGTADGAAMITGRRKGFAFVEINSDE